ncbi:PREDICTED: protein CIP2A homolog [Amphimedon queenslandica]|nr:PREDICTED: protein CIP2A homolog [Amphimedon queenslandica]|eukprot:XP_019860199.1 PREDICTED: protein CIP2A homolog [Amphimedon queenslandica]
MQLEAKNNELSQSLQRSQEQEFASKTKIDELKAKQSIRDNLKAELESLTKEHLLLEELYHQQKLSLSTLRRENVRTQQTKELNESLVREKEGASNSVSVLRREVAKLQMLLKDRETDIKNKEGQIATLKESLWKAQEKYVEKTKSLESKYQCIKNINQELEESLFSFKNRPVHRSRHHKRSESSHLSHSVTPTNTGNVTPTM